MGIFNKLFGFSKNNKVNMSQKEYDLHGENKSLYKCEVCGVNNSSHSMICWKCGNDKNIISLESRKKVDYNYPNIEVIKNNELKNALLKNNKNEDICVPIGLDDENKLLFIELAKMPNLLIGGTVMSGKTNFINSLIMSLITCYSPNEVKLVIADSKGVDYNCYNGISNLLVPVIKDQNKLMNFLIYEEKIMKERYTLLENKGLKKITDYNKIECDKTIPRHFIIIDDYVSFSNDKESEFNEILESITGNGWNVGIHLIIVANHPSQKILSSCNLINFPSRISFKVPSVKDSKMILDVEGAEKISGVGNALFKTHLLEEINLIHTINISDDDIINITDTIKNSNKCEYLKIFEEKNMELTSYEEPLYDEIVDFVVEQGKASTSLLQRRFRLGYNRAARCLDLLEERGIIGPQNGATPREVLINYLEDE